MTFCPFCGAQCEEGAVICSACGRQIAQAPAGQPVQPAVPQKKRSPVFGILMLAVSALFALIALIRQFVLYRMIAPGMPFRLRSFYAIFRLQPVWMAVLAAGMILIAVCYLARFPKRGSMVLAGVGAALFAFAEFAQLLSAAFTFYLLCNMLTAIGAVVLAVYWFTKEEIRVMGIVGAALCAGSTFIIMVLSLAGGGIMPASPLFWLNLLGNLCYTGLWALVLIAVIAGGRKQKA